MISVTHTDRLCWSYNHMADALYPSTALAFVTIISEKHKCTLPSAIQVKKQSNAISTEEK